MNNSFFDHAVLELKRAERYQLFVSLIVLDLSFVSRLQADESSKYLNELLQVVEKNTRIFDNVSMVSKEKLVLLLPETTRQGAEMAARRLRELIRRSLSELSHRQIDETIPLEMASYPDAAGAKPLSDFLEELVAQSKN